MEDWSLFSQIEIPTESELGKPLSKSSNGGLWMVWETDDLI
jgi:hypothetical protein